MRNTPRWHTASTIQVRNTLYPQSVQHTLHASIAVVVHNSTMHRPHVWLVHIASLPHDGKLCGADDYNWCAVPHRPWDTLLFAGIAVVIACLSQGPYSSLIVLVAGELCVMCTQTGTKTDCTT
jgi:hypothetical protein